MGMPITVEVVAARAKADIAAVFAYFKSVDEKYSTYKATSEISQINDGLPKTQWSQEMTTVLDLCQQTKRLTNGYFDIKHDGKLDPSGLVKGWAINNAASLLRDKGVQNFYIEAGGDIQVQGNTAAHQPWAVGILSVGRLALRLRRRNQQPHRSHVREEDPARRALPRRVRAGGVYRPDPDRAGDVAPVAGHRSG